MDNVDHDVTEILQAASSGDRQAAEELIPLVYDVWDVGGPEFVGLTAMAPGQGPPPEIDVSFDFFEVATVSAPESESPPSQGSNGERK